MTGTDAQAGEASPDRLLPLFAYGTLRDPDYQRELFGRTYHMHRARVPDFIVTLSPTGYLAAAPRTGSLVEGAIVLIDAPGLTIADAWEDLRVYNRIEVDAYRLDGRAQRCYMYVVPESDGRPVYDRRLADRSRAEVIADIRSFRATLADRLEQ